MRPSSDDAVGINIIDSAVSLVVKGGVNAMTTDALATAAGVSKATIYRRWNNRREILADVARRIISPVEIPDLGDLEAEIRFLLEYRWEQYQKQGSKELLSSMVGASVEDPEIRKLMHDWVHFQKSENVAMINRAMARGEIDAHLLPDDLASIIAAPMIFQLTLEGKPPQHSLVEAVLQVIRALKGDLRSTKA